MRPALLFLSGCVHLTMSSFGPTVTTPTDPKPAEEVRLAADACDHLVALGCGCPKDYQKATPEMLWCWTRARTCWEAEDCR